MSAKTTRILKEARALFLPWCAVTVAALLPLVKRHHLTEAVSLIAFWAGIPLLATLSVGNEFQHRTLSLLLSQPVSRMEIWTEKLSVTVVAVLSVALVFLFTWRVVPLGLEPQGFAFAGAWTIGIFASATFWTLFTRSTLGGMALNIAVHTFIIILPWEKLADRIRGGGYLSPANPTVLAVAFVFVCYAGAMLWVGRRTLARFQVTGGKAGDDLLMAGPDVMPGPFADWFRCRPTGAVLNLIRKELRLLRPLWLITLLAVLGWTCLTALGLVPKAGSTSNSSSGVTAVMVMGVFSTLILAVLAGSLSLGEERTSGTHSWHMTLPVSARRQWLIKLLMALFAGLVCAVLLPGLVLITGGFLFGSPFMFVDVHTGMVWLLIVSLLSLVSFWCASAVNGTVRAVLWVFPVMVALSLAGEFGCLAGGFGGWAAGKLMDLVISRFDFFTYFRFTYAVSNIFGWRFNFLIFSLFAGPVSNIFGWRFNFLIFSLFASPVSSFGFQDLDTKVVLIETILFVPMLLFVVVQSYRLFRSQVQDSIGSVIRNLLPLATMVFLYSFSLVAFFTLLGHAREQMWTPLWETVGAIEKIQPGTARLDAAHPMQLTVGDLAKASPLSGRTRRWLQGSAIVVAPGKDHSWYLATIHMASGSECTLSFQPGGGLSFQQDCVRLLQGRR